GLHAEHALGDRAAGVVDAGPARELDVARLSDPRIHADRGAHVVGGRRRVAGVVDDQPTARAVPTIDVAARAPVEAVPEPGELVEVAVPRLAVVARGTGASRRLAGRILVGLAGLAEPDRGVARDELQIRGALLACGAARVGRAGRAAPAPGHAARGILGWE